MCGIFGITTSATTTLEPEQVKRIFTNLLLLSESRGKEAAGLAAHVGEAIHSYKTPTRAREMIKQAEYQLLTTELFDLERKSLSIIGHSRLETNGSHLLNKNNQPVATQNIIGVHNGICVNYQKLWKKVNSLKPQTDLDTEAMFAFLDEQADRKKSITSALKALFAEIAGSATIAAYHRRLPQLILATNTGSLFFIHLKNNYFIFSSERYILTQICEKEHLNVGLIEQLRPGHGGTVDLKKISLEVFNLQSGRTSKARTASQFQSPVELYAHAPLDAEEKKGSCPTRHNALSALRQHRPERRAVADLRRCTKCILPETMPLISFDEEGVCNYCRNHKPISHLGKEELMKLVAPFRRQDGQPDCIVAFSGGRDSSYGLHLVKKELGLHPIAYTYDWGMITDLGRRNQARMVGALGVEHIIVSADIKRKRDNIRKNVLAWLKKPDLGMVPLFMAGDKQAEFYAEELKRKTGIKLVFYCRGNELENEEFKWGHCGITNGSPQGVLHNLSVGGKLQLARYYGTQFLLNPSYLNSSLWDTAFAYCVAYLMPLEFVYLWHYLPWEEKKIVSTLKREYDWETETDVSWRIDDGSVAFYNYIFYKMQGFTENDTFRSNQVREGIITRQKALELATTENQPRYDSLKWYFDTLDLDGEEVLSTIDRVARF